ncbi:MAG: carboxypeptidase-like regulatory domain-containing protein [Planctomycetota bacterium]
MKKGPLLALVAAALVGLLVWFLVKDDGRGSGPNLGDGGTAEATSGAARDVDLAGAKGTDDGARHATSTDGLATEVGAATTAAVTFTGRVVLPSGTPADERAIVFAVRGPLRYARLVPLEPRAHRGEVDGADGVLATAEVAADGSFELELAEDAGPVHLAVFGRYVYSLVATRADRDAPVVLAPALGAWITGSLAPSAPSGASTDVEAVALQLRPDLVSGLDTSVLDVVGQRKETETGPDGAFELRAVPPIGGYELVCTPDASAAFVRRGVRPSQGEHLRLDLALPAGATLRGRVVDERGAAFPGAVVTARFRGRLGDASGPIRSATAGDDGAFVLEHVAAGRVDLVARPSGFAESRLSVEPVLEDGAVVEGLVLEVARGASIEGRVVFPDGEPAEGVEVVASVDLSQLTGVDAMTAGDVRGASATSDAGGRFTLAGVTPSLFRLQAAGEFEEGAHAGGWAAVATKVEAGTVDVEIELARLLELAGTVVSAEGGEPIADFTVRATLQGSGAMLGIGAKRVEQTYHADDGTFVLTGLDPGTWDLFVAAPGRAPSPVASIAMPRPEGSEPFVVALLPAARVEGRVVDAHGTPVVGAVVSLVLPLKERVDAAESGRVPSAVTTVGGEFVFVDLDTGTYTLVAAALGFAPSETTAVDVVSGAVTADVVLVLRVGGTITGVVFDDDGAPSPGRLVTVQDLPDSRMQHLTVTDGDGEFEVERLAAGKWQVIAMRNVMGDEGNAGGMAALVGGMKVAMVDVVDGEETHVVLGEAPPEPVDVTGRVTHAGRPVEGILVSMVPQGVGGGAAVGQLKLVSTDADGAFATRLDRAGDYLVTVQRVGSAGQQNSVEFHETVPSGSTSWTLELELPGGSVAGRVRGADGEPLADCRITVNVDDGVALGTFMGGGYVEASTDADGFYEVEYLRGGTYSVAAGGVPLAGLLGGDSKGGRVVRRGVVVGDGERVDGVDFHLEEPARIAGRVLEPNGSPVAGAAIFVRGDDGSLLERLSLVTTDGGGRFTYPGLAPGSYTVSARKGSLVSDESASVRVGGEEQGDVVLTLVVGNYLLVSATGEVDPEEELRITVRDRDDRVVSGMLGLAEIMDRLGDGLDPGEQRVGPVPDGSTPWSCAEPTGASTRGP